MERNIGFEPMTLRLETFYSTTELIPHKLVLKLVGNAGFEPATCWTKRVITSRLSGSNQTELIPESPMLRKVVPPQHRFGHNYKASGLSPRCVAIVEQNLPEEFSPLS